MNKILIALAAATMLTGGVYAQSMGERTGANSMLGAAPTTADFAKEAAASDLLEIEAARIAQQKGNDEEKKFAARMITDHTKSTDDLKRMERSGDFKATLPTTLDSSAQSKLDKLKTADPQNFAAIYDPMQVDAHKKAVSLFERYAKSGDNAKLKDWAGKTLPILKHHLAMANKMNEDRRNQTVGSSKMAPARNSMHGK